MAISLSLLEPLPKAAKFINYTDFDIVPITDTIAINLPLQNGDRMYVSPPTNMYLIDGNNNAYKNIRPPTDSYAGNINVIREVGQYNVYENLNNTLINPMISTGWRLDIMPPSRPIKEEQKIEPVVNYGTTIIWLILFICFCLILTHAIDYNRQTYNASEYRRLTKGIYN